MTKLVSAGLPWRAGCFAKQVCLPQGRNEVERHGGVGLAYDRSSGDQHHVHRLPQRVLVQAERFPEQSARPRTGHGIADSARSNDPHAAAGTRRQDQPIEDQAALRESIALRFRPRKVAPLLDPAGPGQTLRGRGRVHDRSARSILKQESIVCVPCGADCVGWHGRSWWNCG